SAPNSSQKDPATKDPATIRPPRCGATQAKAPARSHQAQINAPEAADRTQDQTALAPLASATRQAPLRSPRIPKAAAAPNSRPISHAALLHLAQATPSASSRAAHHRHQAELPARHNRHTNAAEQQAGSC